MTVPVPFVNVPLFVQLPPRVIVPDPEVMAPVPETFPVTVTLELFVFNAAVPPVTLQLLPTETVPEAVVFTPAPEKVRLE